MAHLCTISVTEEFLNGLNSGYRVGSPTAVQAWQPYPLWEPSPSHPILV